MDLYVYDLAHQLLEELSAALAHTRAGAADLAVVHPGDMVPQYGCAVAAVRVLTVVPVEIRGSACATEWQATFEMSVDRCYKTPDANEMPPLPVLDSATRDALEDAGAMRKAAVCAWARTVRRQFGPWTPRGPAGGIHGGAMTVTARALTLTCECGTEQWGTGIDSRIPPLPGDPRVP